MRAPDLAAIASAAAARVHFTANTSAICKLADTLGEWEEPTIDADTLLDMCREATTGHVITFFRKIVDQYAKEVGLPVDVPAGEGCPAASYFDANALFDMVVGLALEL